MRALMVTSDELGDDGLALSCRVGGDQFQSASTADLLFGPAELVAYISTVITLVPADIIAKRHARRRWAGSHPYPILEGRQPGRDRDCRGRRAAKSLRGSEPPA
jgi:hypothetical protein